MNRLFATTAAIWCGVLLGWHFAACAQADEVVYRDSHGKEHRRIGTVLDYSSAGVKIEGSGRQVTFPVQGVERIVTAWNAAHQRADELFDAHDHAAALAAYRQAFNDESRGWVKRKVLARIVVCQQSTGDTCEACTNFARLIEDDANTPYFAAIPLSWTTDQPEPNVRKLARDWIVAADQPTKQLIAASWLLLSADQPQATAALRTLSRDVRPEISGLAVAQFWRTQLLTAREVDVERWQAHIAKLPVTLRAGPYYLLGGLLTRLGRWDEAALTLLRVPALYGDDTTSRLSQSALLESAKAMREQGETDDARRLYRQAIDLAKDTLAGRAAQEGLSSLNP